MAEWTNAPHLKCGRSEMASEVRILPLPPSIIFIGSGIMKYAIIFSIILVQLIAGLWHITDPFIDGRYHYNWGPPFWLMNAKATNDAGFSKSYFGIARDYEVSSDGKEEKISFYASHPELIGPAFALWTRVFGYSEWSPRLFTLLLTITTTFLLFVAFYKSFGLLFASVFSALFAALPLIYIYGKMLDPVALVLFSLSVALVGFVKVILGEKYSFIILFAGIFAMGSSDWSGFVFGGLIIALSIFLLRHDSVKLKKALLLIAGALILSLLAYFIQIYLQSGRSVYSIIDSYFGLLKYRAGIGANDQVGWKNYFWSQIYYFKDNFTLPLVILGTIGIFLAAGVELKKRGSVAKIGAALFVLSIFVGEAAYSIFLKQGSLRHVYYQYYFAIPFAFGNAYFLYWCAEKFISKKNKTRAFAVAGAILVLFAGWTSYKHYTSLLFQDIWGDASDIKLIKVLRDIPMDKKIAVIADELTLEWFSNPNIEYYAERPLEKYLIGAEGEASYYIVPLSGARAILAKLNLHKQNKFNIEEMQALCSKNFCLVDNNFD